MQKYHGQALASLLMELRSSIWLAGEIFAMPTAVRQSRGRVLVVQDEAIVLDVLTRILRHSGFDVITASDGAQAYELFHLHASELALIVAEMALPNMSGPELIGRLPTLEPRVPVIFTSDREENNCFGIPILRKPFRAVDLKQMLDVLASGYLTP